MRREKNCNHFKPYESNINDPIFTKKLKFPSTKKMTSDKNFFLVMARIMIAMAKDIPKRLRLSFRSKAGSEKNILFFTTFSNNLRGLFFV